MGTLRKISLFVVVLGIFLVAIGGIVFFARQPKPAGQHLTNLPSGILDNPTTATQITDAQNGGVGAAASSPSVAGSGGTSSQVSAHDTSSSCWIIILGKVYDVTNFLSSHPGGISAITPYCGKDATSAFQTHGYAGGANHSAYAYSLLPSYYIGDLSSSATASISTTSIPKPPPAPVVAKFSDAQVIAHHTRSSCWIVIFGRVYDVTSFLTVHPGGASIIISYCGTDATVAFQTHGEAGEGNHSAYAYSLLPSYYIGDLSTSTGGGTLHKGLLPGAGDD